MALSSDEKPYFSERRMKRTQWIAFWVVMIPLALLVLALIA
ncbi:hypothetical protein [Acidiphilium sp.]|nr:hypothetical protein [Acidiphilium sp.]HQT62542.1 hypothetical protein [Acidiphilium sp.]